MSQQNLPDPLIGLCDILMISPPPSHQQLTCSQFSTDPPSYSVGDDWLPPSLFPMWSQKSSTLQSSFWIQVNNDQEFLEKCSGQGELTYGRTGGSQPPTSHTTFSCLPHFYGSLPPDSCPSWYYSCLHVNKTDQKPGILASVALAGCLWLKGTEHVIWPNGFGSWQINCSSVNINFKSLWSILKVTGWFFSPLWKNKNL